MNAGFIRIAAAKTSNAAMAASLRRIEALALHVEEGERSFGARIDANKARRGEGPTALRASQQARLAALAQDQAALDAELARDLDALPDALEVIRAVHMGMSLDLPSSRKLLGRYHPDDLPLGEDLLARKQALVSALAEFLASYAAGAGPDAPA